MFDTVEKRILHIQDELKLSKIEIGELAGSKTPSQSVNNWIKRNSISSQASRKLSKKTGFSFEWIINGSGDMYDLGNISQNHEDIDNNYNNRIDVKDRKSYIINPLDVFNKDDVMTKSFRQDIITMEMALDYAVSVFGTPLPANIQQISALTDSMKGTIDPGENVFVDRTINKFIGDGIYLFLYKGFVHMKRLQIKGDILAVISDNKKYDTWEIKPEDIIHLQVIGQIDGSQQNKYTKHR